VGLDLYAQSDQRNPYPEFGGFDPSLANDHLSFCEADVTEKIPFDNDFFDCVYCISVLEHLTEQVGPSSIHFRPGLRPARRLKNRAVGALARVGLRDTFRDFVNMIDTGRRREPARDKPRSAEELQRNAVLEMLRVVRPGGLLTITMDYIPSPIKTSNSLSGVLQPCRRKMDYDFRNVVAVAQERLADRNVHIPSDEEVSQMRDEGLLLLCATVAPREFYHFTSVGFAFIK
jgi:SAM-dependent methyltransferase